jgi:hypothetical protein
MANVSSDDPKRIESLCTTCRTAAEAVLDHKLESNRFATLAAHGEYVILPKNDFMDWAMGIVNRRVHARLRH